jgi:NAD(P) transhydrogenase subunit beta
VLLTSGINIFGIRPAIGHRSQRPNQVPAIARHDRVHTVFVLKRSMASGFAGIENPLFFNDNTTMIFGDAKKTLQEIVSEFKAA